jgi:hypothetical protein
MRAVGGGNDPFTVEARLCALHRTAMGKRRYGLWRFGSVSQPAWKSKPFSVAKE